MARDSQPPTRKSIELLGRRVPLVAGALQAHHRGSATYEEALRIALVAVCDQNAVLAASLRNRQQNLLNDQRLGIAKFQTVELKGSG